MAFFNSKLRYALCAAIDLAMQPPTPACQSREIAARQNIPGPYLDQILAALKSAGIVRSVRGAGGGYNLARPPERISVGDIARALMRTDRLFSNAGADSSPDMSARNASWIVRSFEEQVEADLSRALDATTLADLAQRKMAMDESLSFMPDI
ncbi:MAG TPA: Rrf2 family transcriptional regulator [Chthonomonadaceae bacterium]|nr:Rrf2 family transcriptional regulator [Chthonomonadaceae bacterium]